MKKLIYIISLLLLQATAASLLAQDKPKAGDLIQGVVTDSVSPLMAVFITELDSAGRAVAYAYTDLKGEFSFHLVNPKDRIQFSYYRKEKIVLLVRGDLVLQLHQESLQQIVQFLTVIGHAAGPFEKGQIPVEKSKIILRKGKQYQPFCLDEI